MEKKERILTDLPIIKFDKIGTMVKGVICNIEESKKFKDSWVITMSHEGNRFVVFVPNLVRDKLVNNGVEIGSDIKLTYIGKKVSKASGREYNDFEVAVFD